MKAITFAVVLVSLVSLANTAVADADAVAPVTVDLFVAGDGDKISTIWLGEDGKPCKGLELEVVGHFAGKEGERTFLVRWRNPWLRFLPGALRLVLFEKNGSEWVRLELRFAGGVEVAGPWKAGDLYLR